MHSLFCPGVIIVTDVTEILNFGYFPSYNVPMSPIIFQLAGYAEMVQKFGQEFSYHGAPR